MAARQFCSLAVWQLGCLVVWQFGGWALRRLGGWAVGQLGSNIEIIISNENLIDETVSFGYKAQPN